MTLSLSSLCPMVACDTETRVLGDAEIKRLCDSDDDRAKTGLQNGGLPSVSTSANDRALGALAESDVLTEVRGLTFRPGAVR